MAGTRKVKITAALYDPFRVSLGFGGFRTFVLFFFFFFAANGNSYDGQWRDGVKHGEGVYVFKNKGRSMEGVWIGGVPKIAVIKHTDWPDDTAVRVLPEVSFNKCEYAEYFSRLKRDDLNLHTHQGVSYMR